jgi:hypothetical protein
MKICLILTGYFKSLSLGDSAAGHRGYNYLKDFLIHFDNIVVHTWDHENYINIHDLYHPDYMAIERPIDFSLRHKKVADWQRYYDQNFDRGNSYLKTTIKDFLSQLYSRQSGVRSAQRIDGIDYFLITRFDLSCRGPRECWELERLSKIIDYIKHHGSLANIVNTILPEFAQFNAGYPDYWTFFPRAHLAMFANLFDNAMRALEPGGLYEKLMTQGWPDSEYFNFDDHYDNRQFSNLQFSSRKMTTATLMRYPLYYVPNIHSLLKFLFLTSEINCAETPVNLLYDSLFPQAQQ